MGEEEGTEEAKLSAIRANQPQQDLMMALTPHKALAWLLLINKIHLSALPAYWKSSDTAAGAKPTSNPMPGEKHPE